MADGKPKRKHTGGRRRRTNEEFIAEARAVHGDRYDYSQVDYQGNGKHVTIICPIHGPFRQTPGKHLKGRGCPNMECINARRQATCMAHFGVPHSGAAPEVRAKMRATSLERYGTENPAQSEVVKERVRETVRRKYGVDCSFQAESVKAKRRATFEAKYGGDSPMCRPEAHEKAAETMLARYGARAPLGSEAARAKYRSTLASNFGEAGNPMDFQAVRDRVTDSKRRNGTFHTSGPEERAYAALVGFFGEEGVLRQYRSEAYPWACDFYLPAVDFYIEINASWTHGGHWYDPEDPGDRAREALWRERLAAGRLFYREALGTWTVRDARKRQRAIVEGLNYLVFWDQDLSDFHAWLDSLKRE